MKTKKLVSIVLCIVSGTILTGVLVWNFEMSTPHNNGFIRFFPPHFLTNKNVLEIETFPFKITGIDSKSIYLGTPYRPLVLKVVNYKTREIKNYDLSTPDERIAWKKIQTYISPPHIYLTEGITPTILHSDINTLRFTRKTIDSTHFSKCIPISPDRYILKTYNTETQQDILVCKSLHPIQNKTAPNVLEKQIDGVFCTEGDLLYNRENNRLVYIYRYRNQFLYLDTDLNLIYKGNTIDTTSKAKIKVAEIESGPKKQYILATPPLIVNKKSSTYGDQLYVCSNIIASNEDRQKFHGNSVIDIYNLKNGDYMHSFYIPAHQGKQIQDFAVYNHTLIALYNGHIIIFKMQLP